MDTKKKWCIIIIVFIIVLTIVLCVLFLNIHSVKEHKNYFSKSYKQKSVWYPYLSAKEGFLLESHILKTLENNYECICQDKKRIHFPILIKMFEKKKKIYISKCGVSIYKLSSKQKNIFKNIDFKPQIKCIIYNLNKNNIIHNDIKLKNMTLSNDGTLGLIDFELAEIKKYCVKNVKSKNLYKNPKNNNKYEDILKILNLSRLGQNTSML